MEVAKPWTKVQQQPWSDVFEGMEGDGTTHPGFLVSLHPLR